MYVSVSEEKVIVVEYYRLETSRDESFKVLILDKQGFIDNSQYFWNLFHFSEKGVYPSVENFIVNTFPMELLGGSEEKRAYRP